MRNQVISIMALGIALAIVPATSFAKGGGGGGGGGGAQHFSTGAGPHPGGNHPTGGHGWGGNVNQKPPAGSGNSAGSKTINCQAGGGGCQRQH
ncbi:MAG TPA: hypothetical protein VH558_16220 [Pseudolabrys sp.]|jgi:hypothetical protein